ncbi:MAG: DNA repair protein RecO [candidate division WOR-3 bacterium]
MRRIVKTEAVCLRQRRWRESSKVVTLLTQEIGIITGIAKGARRPQSPLGPSLNLFAHSQLVLYLARTGDMCTLTDAELISTHSGIALDPNRLVAASQIAEFLLNTLPPHHPEMRIFKLLVTYLSAIENASTPSLQPLLLSFLLKALTFLGYKPELNHCLRCRSPISETANFNIARGGVVCATCLPKETTSRTYPLTIDQINLLKSLLHTPAAEIAQKFETQLNQQIPGIIINLIKHHFHPKKFPSLQPLLRSEK